MLLRISVLSFLLFCFSGCATVPRPVSPPAGEVSLQTLCQKYAMECNWDGISQTVSMSYKGTRIQALVGSNLVVVGNSRLPLSGPLRRRKEIVMVPPDFERVVIGPATSPLAGAPPGLPKRLGKVVIDAGHGGKDPGATGYGGAKEKDINLDIAARVRDGLAKAGVNVVMTRDKDEFISLARRTEIASRPDIELFVSIHANANRGRGAHGIEVYYTGALNAGDRSDDQRQDNERKLCGQFKMKAASKDVQRIVLNLLYNYKLSAAPGIADRIARHLANEMGGSFRGSKPQRYFVLRNTLIPAVLIEVGFISNPREGRRLNDPAYRQEVADAVTQSVMEYLYAAGI
jgi:N-acetylmuramoyl-L-alanine amidase